MPKLSDAPTFKMHGSKALQAKWIVSYFPEQFEVYLEPFAGRGNVLLRVLANNTYGVQKVRANDRYMSHFLAALHAYEGDFSFIPEDPITRDIYEHWFNQPPSLERSIVECVLAYNGNAFGAGANITQGSKNRHNRLSTIERLVWARKLLQGVYFTISGISYRTFLEAAKPDYFCYLDPPYQTSKAFYPNISLNKLVVAVNSLPCKWALSESLEPDKMRKAGLNFERVICKERTATARCNSGLKGQKTKMNEFLYLSY